MNVHDWLANLPFSDPESGCRIVEVSFNNGSRKDYFKNTTNHFFEKGDMVALEGINGFDIGSVNLTGELVRLQLKKNNIKEDSTDIKKVLRRANETDLNKCRETKAKEKDVMIRSRAIARQLNLEMKVAEVEIQADGRKATFFYIADDRVAPTKYHRVREQSLSVCLLCQMRTKYTTDAQIRQGRTSVYPPQYWRHFATFRRQKKRF